MITRINIQTTLRSALAVGLLAIAQAVPAQVAVVVNPKSPIANMTTEQVAGIFMGKTNTLPSGATAVLVDQPESNPVREQFYSKAAGKSLSQVKASWARLTFSGKATPPKEVGTAAEVKKFIVANPDAIGYIEKSAVDGTVKAVLTIE